MIIVAGIARSGLTMIMQMLYAGGYPCVGEPPAFEKYNMGNIPWSRYRRQMVAVKAVGGDKDLPPWDFGPFDVIYLKRNLDEQAKSTNKFNKILNGLPPCGIDLFVDSFRREHMKISGFYRDSRVLELTFESVLDDPLAQAEMIIEWLEYRTHPEMDAEAMADAVFRRGPLCLKGLMEWPIYDMYAGRCSKADVEEWVDRIGGYSHVGRRKEAGKRHRGGV